MIKSVKSNFIYNLIYQLISIIVPLILIPYVSRTLGVESVGLYSYAESIVSYFVLFAGLGSVTYAQREISATLDNKIDSSRLFWEIFIIRLFTSCISLFSYYLIIIRIYQNNLLYLILCLNIVSVIFDISWFYNGKEEFCFFSLICSIGKIVSAIFVFLFVKDFNDVSIYIFIMSGSLVFTNLFSWLFLPKHICKTTKINPFKHIKNILILFIPNIAVQVYSVLDKSMIGWFSIDTVENGYYEYAEKIVRICVTVITALSTVLISRVSKNFAEKDDVSLYKVMRNAISYVWFISLPMMFGLFAIADYLIPIYLGNSFKKSIMLVRILSPIIVFVGMASIIGVAFLISIKKQNVNVIAVVFAAIINACINLILIPKLYSVGAAIGTVCAEFIGVFIQCFYVFKKKYLSCREFFKRAWKYAVSSIIMFVAIILLKLVLTEINIINLLILVLFGVVIYSLSIILLKDEFVIDTLKKVFGKIKRKKQTNK